MKKALGLLLLAVLMAAGCVETVVMDPLEEMPVVVQCVLQRNNTKPEASTQTLDLYYARRPSDRGFTKITDAIVRVRGGGQTHEFSWTGERWTSVFLPEFDTEYVLDIRLPGGKELSAKTRFPRDMYLQRLPVYNGIHRDSYARYAKVCNCEGNAYIWITAPDEESDITRFYTNHPGTDNSNIINERWENQPIADSIRSDYKSLRNDLFFSEMNPVLWDKFYGNCIDMPVHK